MILDLTNPYWGPLVSEHREWLNQFHSQYLVNWNRLLKADDEAALCEAIVRSRLQKDGFRVEPNENLTDNCGGPDYHCFSDKIHFYVEVTCIKIATATKEWGDDSSVERILNPIPTMATTRSIFSKCQKKASQCAGLDGPVLVAIGTFHWKAATLGFSKVPVECVLTGNTMLAWDVDPSTGKDAGETYQTTELTRAAFLSPDETQGIGYARNSISGVLLCNLSSASCISLGVLHPNPLRRFDSSLLPTVDFGEIEIDRSSKSLRIRWTSEIEE